MEAISSSTMNTMGRAFQEAHNIHLGPLELNIYAPPSRTEMTIFVTHNVIIGRDTFQAHPTPKIICGVGTWKCPLLIGPHTMSNILSSRHLWLGNQENLYMFKRSNSRELYFLGRETYTKEIAIFILFFLECWNWCIIKFTRTHSRFIG
jgi:hypothetical protein